MIRFLVLLLFVLSLVGLPLFYLDQQVMPELLALKDFYGHADATARQVVQK